MTKNIDIAGMTKDVAMTTLIQGGMSFSDATSYYAKNKSTTVGFSGRLFERLRKGNMDEKEFETMLAGESANTNRNKKKWDAIRVLVNNVRDGTEKKALSAPKPAPRRRARTTKPKAAVAA